MIFICESKQKTDSYQSDVMVIIVFIYGVFLTQVMIF